MNKYMEFVNSIESDGTKQVAITFREIGNYNFTNCTTSDIYTVISNLKPKGIREIRDISRILKLYAKYLNDNNMKNIIENIDFNELWLHIKPAALKRYLSNHKYIEICHEISMYEEENPLYKEMLFRCIYEGIYCEDMSVIKNLRASDISGNIVALRSDFGDEYQLQVSSYLIEGLIELSKMKTWDRKNRYTIYKTEVVGMYPDSCFKIEMRKDSKYNYRFNYYTRLRNIAKRYAEGYKLTPTTIFISGVIYRISLELEKYNISLQDAFKKNNRNRLYNEIISKEFERCNHSIRTSNFRSMIEGCLDNFVDSK